VPIAVITQAGLEFSHNCISILDLSKVLLLYVFDSIVKVNGSRIF
jgi:hypothetical protein